MLSVIPEAKGKISRSNLVVGKANPFRGLSNDMKLLLRADSLFRNNCSSQAHTYGEIVRFLKTDSGSHMGNEYVDYEWLWEAEDIRAYPFARKTAKESLKIIGCPDANYLELEEDWVYGRCIDSERRSWSQMAMRESGVPLDEKVRQCRICVSWPIKRDVRGRAREIFKHLLEVEEIRIIKMEEDVPDSESESEKPNVVKEEFDSECDSETVSWLGNL
ncbi:hypothetical protein RHS04_08173 [Rhizoctonia solani]|uniref:Uncharacterized protein n=1 Tax=Rhizoctonia solani TaxID=456999 RepID=A0A8H7H3H8_9AGAM|nr:hypothetical protein RHS04_08173 [Rhizoctonia solani]